MTQGSLAELRQSASRVRAVSPQVLRVALENSGGVVEFEQPDTLVVRGLSLDEIGDQAFRAGIALHELSPHTDSLEDRFFAWTGGAEHGGTQRNAKEEQ